MTRPVRSCRLAALTLALCLVLPAVASAQFTETVGQAGNGSFYKFRVPDGWQTSDGLVIWNHGFSLDPVSTSPDLGPLVDVQLAQGYAVAASSYSQIGWALFQTREDLELMVKAFSDQYGVPDSVIVYGASLGGIVTIQAVEQAELGDVVGAMPICGAIAGSRTWNGGIDVRLLYNYLCDGVPGGAIPGGGGGLPFPPDPAFDETALGIAANTCLGLLTPAGLRTAEQQERLDRFAEISGIAEEFLASESGLGALGIATFGLFDLIYDPGKLAGGQGLGNMDVDYGDPDVNANIERVAADPAARELLHANYTPTGKVGDTKIVSLHTDGDGLILLEHETDYLQKVPADRFTVGVVVEDSPSHCDFSEAEVLAAWESLRGWVAGAPQPTANDLQTTCLGVEGGGLAAGPCRIDPGFELPDPYERIRARSTCVADADTLCLDDGRFSVEVTWRDRDGNSDRGQTLPQTVDTGAFWFFEPTNLELMVKVLDGRQINGKFWVFYGSLSNVEYTITVLDTVTGRVKTYQNPLDNFGSDGDTDAL
ncbi:MAG: hypothetical protein MI919_38520 [Holophagales bacterium]|nr:hypothetical protein [Holophagales bacterium]